MLRTALAFCALAALGIAPAAASHGDDTVVRVSPPEPTTQDRVSIQIDHHDIWVDSFRVTEGEPSLPAALFTVEPAAPAPSDADRTRLMVASRTFTCAPPAFQGAIRQGNTFRLRFDVGEPEPTCLPPENGVLGAELVDLGQLEPGTYLAEVREVAGGAPLASLSFTVQNAADAVTLLGRYRVSIAWKTLGGHTGVARPVALGSGESALFSFFDLANWEVLVKVLDGCSINGHRWVFLAAATDVEFTLTVDDLQSPGPPYLHTSPAGLLPPLADTAALACTP